MYVCWGKYFTSSRITFRLISFSAKILTYSFWHKEIDIGLQIRCYVIALKDLQQITANIFPELIKLIFKSNRHSERNISWQIKNLHM